MACSKADLSPRYALQQSIDFFVQVAHQRWDTIRILLHADN